MTFTPLEVLMMLLVFALLVRGASSGSGGGIRGHGPVGGSKGIIPPQGGSGTAQPKIMLPEGWGSTFPGPRGASDEAKAK